ncbi:MAG: FAD-binding oxidoreductase [Bacteroidia bacterium]|nr:FAD-binding oxidoreductase [Bacteroidia bacterium]MDW8301718.1 FAD-binding oxidoreductase [Bacteroidia bacterium]
MYTASYWEDSAFWQKKWDFIIVGSGIVGLITAHELKNKYPDADILVLERGILPMGASTRNAGVACFGSISELLLQEQAENQSAMLDLVALRFNGLERLFEIVKGKDIEYQATGGYEVFTHDEEKKYQYYLTQIDRINALLEPITKLKQTYIPKDEDIAKFGFRNVAHLIYNPAEGLIHSGKLVFTLWKIAQEMGIFVWNQIEVQEIIPDSDYVQIKLKEHLLYASKVIVATNAFAKKLLPNIDVVPGRGQVCITKPIPNLRLKGAFHYQEGYFYFRNADNNRVLIGGGRNLDFKREETYEFGFTELVQNTLITLLKEMILPDTKFEIEYWWSGIMGFGQEKAPIIQEVMPNVYCAVRMSGMGVAIGSKVAQRVASLV